MKKFWTVSPRVLRLMVPVFGLATAAGDLSPAEAQFFFPFFDNRPSAPPRTYVRPHIWHHEREANSQLRRRARAHREKAPRVEAKRRRPGESKKPAETAPPPVAEGPPPAYEPQLLRLSEIMGALAYLQTICAAPSPEPTSVSTQAKPTAEDAPWRERMESLMTAEGAGPARREKLAGAYNRGVQGYRFSYHVCTLNAQLARSRFLDEGARLAHDISMQYRAN